MKDTYPIRRIYRGTALAAAALLTTAGCDTVKEATSTDVHAQNPYSSGEQATLQTAIPGLLGSLNALVARNHALTQVSPGTGDEAWCVTTFDVPAKTTNGSYGSYTFELDTKINNDGSCPPPAVTNIERMSAELDASNFSLKIDLDDNFRGAGDPAGVVLASRTPEEFIKEDDAPGALSALQDAASEASGSNVVISQETMHLFVVATGDVIAP